MGTIIETALPTTRLMRGYAEGLVADIPPDQFARKAHPGGELVDAVHPAFVFGHLGTYFQRILDLAGLNGAELASPAGFEELFVKGSPCHDDPDGSIYPDKETIMSHYFRGTDQLIELLPTIEDSVLLVENTLEGSKDRFPTVGAFVTFLITTHVGMHMGQVSTWRRAMGLGSVT